MIKPVPHYFRAGYDAGKSGVPATGNPMLFKGWPWHAWRLGQEYGELEAKVLTDGPGVYVEAEHLERADKAPSDQGQAAYAEGRHLEDCPYDPGSGDWTQWRRGWSLAHNEAALKTDNEWQDNFKYRRAGCLSYMLFLVIIVLVVVWAFVTKHPPKLRVNSSALIECQRRVPPWQTGECR